MILLSIFYIDATFGKLRRSSAILCHNFDFVKYIVFLLFVFIIPLTVLSQQNNQCDFTGYCTEKATYKDGGEKGLQQFIASNIIYPDSAKTNNIEGRVIVSFIIDSVGRLSNIHTLRSIKGYGFEEEAIRVLTMTSGNWTPAKQNDKPICIKYRMPIVFALHPDVKPVPVKDTIYNALDVTLPATYTGGVDSLRNRILQNFEWPSSMATTCGRFLLNLEFVVLPDGTISDIKVLNEIQFTELEEAAINALKATNGGWSSAYKDGEPVKMLFNYPLVLGIVTE